MVPLCEKTTIDKIFNKCKREFFNNDKALHKVKLIIDNNPINKFNGYDTVAYYNVQEQNIYIHRTFIKNISKNYLQQILIHELCHYYANGHELPFINKWITTIKDKRLITKYLKTEYWENEIGGKQQNWTPEKMITFFSPYFFDDFHYTKIWPEYETAAIIIQQVLPKLKYTLHHDLFH